MCNILIYKSQTKSSIKVINPNVSVRSLGSEFQIFDWVLYT